MNQGNVPLSCRRSHFERMANDHYSNRNDDSGPGMATTFSVDERRPPPYVGHSGGARNGSRSARSDLAGRPSRARACGGNDEGPRRHSMIRPGDATPLHVAVIIGSTREGRVGDAVGRWVIAQIRQRADFAPAVVDLVDFEFPARYPHVATGPMLEFTALIGAADA